MVTILLLPFFSTYLFDLFCAFQRTVGYSNLSTIAAVLRTVLLWVNKRGLNFTVALQQITVNDLSISCPISWTQWQAVYSHINSCQRSIYPYRMYGLISFVHPKAVAKSHQQFWKILLAVNPVGGLHRGPVTGLIANSSLSHRLSSKCCQ